MKKIISLTVAVAFLTALSFACKKSKSDHAAGTGESKDSAAAGIAVPLGGNAYITQMAAGGTEVITDKGLGNWTNSETIASTYFRLGQTGQLSVSVKASVPSGSSTIKVTINGTPFTITLKGNTYQTYAVGAVPINDSGYVKVDMQGVRRSGSYFADVSDFIISGTATTANVLFANDPENFYWSRRGPSVHLGYTAPASINTEWFYNELTVPVGEDKIGSYFMSNGFGEGYFGIQVNSATERRVLFSVWDPATGKTTLMRKGANVVTNDFGGEGTGGQSYLLYNWKAGTTYEFLTQGRPDGSGGTRYSSWFYAPEAGAWKFIATWQRPNTVTYLTNLHSFLENFIDTQGWLGRKVNFTNQWARSNAGTWTELTGARFTADATARNGQRKDYAGGVENGQFFLKNGGFFAGFINYDTKFTRPATGRQPTIDFDDLP